MEPNELSEKSRLILEAIADGHSYEQILSGKPGLSFNDIFRAAGEALECLDQPAPTKTYEKRMAEIRQTYPRAYEKWVMGEDAQLAVFFRDGKPSRKSAEHCNVSPVQSAADWEN
jgi:hypothetical protein